MFHVGRGANGVCLKGVQGSAGRVSIGVDTDTNCLPGEVIAGSRLTSVVRASSR